MSLSSLAPIIRQIAVQKTFDQYNNQSFLWGDVDCAHLVDTHLVYLGHESVLATLPAYNSYRSARVVVAGLEGGSIEAFLDAKFERIDPLSAAMGDIVGYPAVSEGDDSQWIGLGIVIDHRILGFGPDGICSPTSITNATHAWRVTLPQGGN